MSKIMLTTTPIQRMHDEATRRWHGTDAMPAEDDELLQLAEAQHRANFDLWHAEDQVRDPAASDAEIVTCKREIDRLNQRRNDFVEQIDRLLLSAAGAQNEELPLHSETPGMIVDRLSILSLKIFHTAEEVQRKTPAEDHRRRNLERLRILEQQRADLVLCLDVLWTEVLAGRRRFKLYRQLKMYNDPELNPVLYGRPGS